MAFRENSPVHFEGRHQWDINDSNMPKILDADDFQEWPNGHSKFAYRGDCEEGKKHSSGWAMRNTNNHNVNILKKSCLGVLVCNKSCVLDNGKKVTLRPAICDKARKKQFGKTCPNVKCSGKLELMTCGGHCGYPVTHFWRKTNGYIFFQAKGVHDHSQPEVKSCAKSRRYSVGGTKDTKPETKKRGIKRGISSVEIPDHDYDGVKIQRIDIQPVEYRTVTKYTPPATVISSPNNQEMMSITWPQDSTNQVYSTSDFPNFDFGINDSSVQVSTTPSVETRMFTVYPTSEGGYSTVNTSQQQLDYSVNSVFDPAGESTRLGASPTSYHNDSITSSNSSSSGRTSPSSSSFGEQHSLYSTTDARGPFLDDLDDLDLFGGVGKFGAFNLDLLDLPSIESILEENLEKEKLSAVKVETPVFSPVESLESPAWGKIVTPSRGPSPDHSLSELLPLHSSKIPEASAGLYSVESATSLSFTDPYDPLNVFRDLSHNFPEIYSS